MKKIVRLTVVLFMFLFVVGCGSSDASESNNGQTRTYHGTTGDVEVPNDPQRIVADYYLGELLDVDNVTKSVKKQIPFFMNNPKSKASMGIQTISEKLLNMPVSQKGFNSFMKKLKGLFVSGGA